MSQRKAPRKKRKLFEHHAPWFLVTLFGVLTSLLGMAALVSGVFSSPSAFRGHAPLSVALAVVAVLLFMLSGFYLLRRRFFQEESLLRASMQTWLWAHMYLAIFGTWLVLLHAGYGLVTLDITSGKLALMALFGCILSGLVWRWVYAFVPRRAARTVGNYSEASSIAEAQRLTVEIEKLSAGRSDAFQQLKERVGQTFFSDAMLTQACAALPGPEQPALWELAALTERRRRAQRRRQGQKNYLRLLQAWRLLHVPITGMFLLMVPLHVVLAYDLPAKLVGTGRLEGNSLGGFESAESCENCHAAIVKQWRGSMHALAMSRPTMIAQTNQDLATTLKDSAGPDPKDLCINCHGPIGAALTSESRLPLTSSAPIVSDRGLLNEGVSCAVCHQYRGDSFPGHAALSTFKDGFEPGRLYYGPRADPVPNSFHQSASSELFLEPEKLCQNCHSVNYDLNSDAKIEKGTDLVLQTIFEEWQYYRKRGGASSCVDCHMPVGGAKRSAEAAWIPFEQDYEAPERQVRDHTFIGADHRLDVPEAADPHAAARRRLLQSAVALSLEPRSIRQERGSLRFSVRVSNVGAGHRVPGGFAFVRQLWLEVEVLDRNGQALVSSGKVASVEHDLCDAELFTGLSRSVLEFTRGCTEPDLPLVNFQTILLDRIQAAKASDTTPRLDQLGHQELAPAEGAKETFLQHFSGGPVARTRGFDKKPMPPLDPGEERVLDYEFELGPKSDQARQLRVRLLFRAIAPYFLRALGKNQAPGETPVAPLVKNLRIDELGRVTAALGPEK